MFICDGLQHGRIYAEEKRTEKNLIVRSGISEAETTVLIIKDCARGFALKLYRHEALRGLFATAELLVFVCCDLLLPSTMAGPFTTQRQFLVELGVSVHRQCRSQFADLSTVHSQ